MPLPIGDVIKITVSLSAPGTKRDKTFFEKVPERLERLRTGAESLMRRLEQQRQRIDKDAP